MAQKTVFTHHANAALTSQLDDTGHVSCRQRHSFLNFSDNYPEPVLVN